MAYNILKGSVEFSDGSDGSLENTVDLKTNQTINGVKTFVQTVSASAFTSNAGSIVPPALTTIGTDGANRVITSDGDRTATAHANVTITKSSLTASFFSGSAVGLTNLQSTQVVGSLSASQIHLGNGLVSSAPKIAVSGSDGLIVSATGVAARLQANSGLAFSSSAMALSVNPSVAVAITDSGQSLADADSFLVHDASRTQTRKATANDVYTYINSKISSPAVTTYTNSTNNRIITSVDGTTINGEANLTFDGSTLTVTGDATIDKNHSGMNGATVTGLQIDLDKTSATTTDNTMYGLNIDMDNTTATNGNNTMYGLHVTPTLTHAADAGTPVVYGALINAQGGTNGGSLVQGARIEAAGGDFNYGLQLDVEDGGVDLRIESSADNGDYFQIQTTTAGATTITTQDDDGAAAHLTFNVDGNITLDPVGALSASCGVHITGSDPHVAIGDKRGSSPNPIMLNVRPADTDGNNKILALFQRTEGSGMRTCFAVTGSGQVAVGGSHLAGVLNVSGSDSETLISAKSNTKNPAFYVSGSGEMFVSGNVGVNTTSPTSPLDVAGNSIRIRNSNTVANSNDNGSAGEIRWDANYMYICIATNQWRRIAHSTW